MRRSRSDVRSSELRSAQPTRLSLSCTRSHAPRSSRTISFCPCSSFATTGALALGSVRMRMRSGTTESVSACGAWGAPRWPLLITISARRAKKTTARAMTTARPRAWRTAPGAPGRLSVCRSPIVTLVPLPILHEGDHDRLLHVQPVLRFVIDDRLRAVDDLGGNLFAAVRRKTMQEDGLFLRQRHDAIVDDPPGEVLLPLRCLGFLPHRRPAAALNDVVA